MFLQPNEVGFLKYLKEARVPVVEFEFPAGKLVNVQSQLEKLIGKNYYLNGSAKDGYKYALQFPTPFGRGERDGMDDEKKFGPCIRSGLKPRGMSCPNCPNRRL